MPVGVEFRRVRYPCTVPELPGSEVPVTGTSWDIPTTTTITVPLNAGTNNVKFYNDNAYAPDLDRITIDR